MTDNSQLEREQAFALFLARNHARNNGEPLPDPSAISPIGFTRVKPEMSREQMTENLLRFLESIGLTIKPEQDQGNKGDVS